MRLLQVRTLKLQTFYDDEIPLYAILSHTWLRDEDEVTHAQIQDPEACRHMLGFQKIEYTCRQAIRDGLRYAWIDTCCIDKTNSTELSEAINSMFRWYSESHVCYVYLTDVVDLAEASLAASRWWTRAWTLQELIAPRNVQFFNGDWQYMGSKEDLTPCITSITGIDEETLQVPTRMFGKSIAQRLSWAANRKAKRIEDRAYSLIGVMGVFVAMQYGEGSGAFMRLQEAVRQSNNNDQTLFAWNFVPRTIPKRYEEWAKTLANTKETQYSVASPMLPDDQEYGEDRRSCLKEIDLSFGEYLDDYAYMDNSHTGLFAPNLEAFSHCGQIIFHSRHSLEGDLTELNGGWRINMPLVDVKTKYETYRLGLLPCSYADQPYHLLGILLRSLPGPNRYKRLDAGGGAYTFLVDFSSMIDAYTKQVWVEGSYRTHDLQLSQRREETGNYRSIKIRIKVNPGDWSLSESESMKAFSSNGMLLQFPTEWFRVGAGEQTLLSLTYCTGSQINFALGLPVLPPLESLDGDGLNKSRIVVFAGNEKEKDWNMRLKKMWTQVANAGSHTPEWTIQASITTCRVFNQLISTLEITDTNSALDRGNLARETKNRRRQDEPESEIEALKREWKRMRHALMIRASTSHAG